MVEVVAVVVVFVVFVVVVVVGLRGLRSLRGLRCLDDGRDGPGYCGDRGGRGRGAGCECWGGSGFTLSEGGPQGRVARNGHSGLGEHHRLCSGRQKNQR